MCQSEGYPLPLFFKRDLLGLDVVDKSVCAKFCADGDNMDACRFRFLLQDRLSFYAARRVPSPRNIGADQKIGGRVFSPFRGARKCCYQG